MSRLLKATFQCKVTTPMFLGGADSNKPELRASSIRGGMRYWYRALIGGKGELDSMKLFSKEEKIFGSSDEGSSVIVVVNSGSIKTVKGKNFTRNEQGNPATTGIAYLWYSLTLGGTNEKKKGIQPEEEFTVILKSRNRDDLEAAMDSFKLLAAFGGLGSRSRRGAGSFRITDIQCNYSASSDLLDGDKYPLLSEAVLPEQPSFNVYNKSYCDIHRLEKPFPDWKEAIEFLGTKMKTFRLRYGVNKGGDYDQVRAFIKGGKPPDAIDRVRFGLPIGFRFSKISKKDIKNNAFNAFVEMKGNNGENRKASPIFFSIGKNDNNYFINVVCFKSRFLPEGGRVTIGKKNTQAGDASILDEFIETLKK